MGEGSAKDGLILNAVDNISSEEAQMAKVGKNIIIEGLSGSLGDQLVIKMGKDVEEKCKNTTGADNLRAKQMLFGRFL